MATMLAAQTAHKMAAQEKERHRKEAAIFLAEAQAQNVLERALFDAENLRALELSMAAGVKAAFDAAEVAAAELRVLAERNAAIAAAALEARVVAEAQKAAAKMGAEKAAADKVFIFRRLLGKYGNALFHECRKST